ncbi:MAG: hypothetical protein NVSMB51_15540 [Solirubrobacteraceae bacterium]
MSACALCGGPGTLLLTARDRNRELAPEAWVYERCSVCASVFIAEPPPSMVPFYAGDYHGFDEHGRPAWEGNPVLEAAEAFRVALLLEYVPPGPLIEIGAGAGGFAHAAAAAGFAPTAIEMDARCCEYLAGFATAIRSDDPRGALADLAPARVVAMWHVLEHLPEPGEVLRAAAAKLEPGGLLAVGVPNPDSLQFRLLRARWAHLDAPRHLCLIPPAALIEHCRGLGLELVERTTADPFGRDCNRFGWECALRARPAVQPAPRPIARAARLLARAAAPLEASRGSAITLLLRRTAGWRASAPSCSPTTGASCSSRCCRRCWRSAARRPFACW